MTEQRNRFLFSAHMSIPRRILVTSALPYANGPIHIGHLVEYIQTDIWVRFQKLRGNECIYICADDTHGTAIMMSAQRTQCSAEQWIEQIQREHMRDFADFQIEFDNYDIFRAGKYEQMNPLTRKKLYKFFKPHNERLYKLINMNFDWN